MKRIILALLILLSVTASAAEFVDTDNAQRTAVQQAAVKVGRPVTIPSDPGFADPDGMYAAINAAAIDAQVNVFRTAVGYTPEGQARVTQYVLLTTDTRLFGSLELRSGRWLRPGDDPGLFLSTAQTGLPDQVGVIGDFGGNDLVDVRGLRAAFDSLPVSATYLIEAPDDGALTRFLDAFAREISSLARAPGRFTAEDFRGSDATFRGYRTGYGPLLAAVQFLIIFFTALFLAFQVLRSAKHAGVMKLHGYGAFDVWFDLAGRLILMTAIAATVIGLTGTLLVPDTTLAFTGAVGASILRAFGVTLVASAVACGYVARADISNSIKNRSDTRGVFVLNTLVKTGCSILLIAVGAGLWLQYASATSERERLGNWDRAHGYGIFYPSSVGNDLFELETGGLATTETEVYDLYPAMNSLGALYVDAINYQPGAMTTPPAPGAYRSMQVNVNYLNQFPLLDESGRRVEVGEDTTDWVVLAPARYRAEEAAIRAYFQVRRTGNAGQQGVAQAAWAMFGRESPVVARQRVSIIWTRDGQEVFSFDPAVNPDAGNTIVDPFIEVMTAANSVGVDRLNMVTGAGGTALKVPLIAGDTTRTLRELLPTLERLRLDDNLRHLVTMDEYVSQQIATLDQGLQSIAVAGVALLLALFVLAVQSVLILFERYSRRITVRKLFGWGFVRTYRELVILFTAVWGVQLVGAFIANRLGLNPFSTSTSASVADDRVVIVIAAGVAFAEWLLSAGVLTAVERRRLVRMLKEEF